jgi:hypothetical protein
MPDITTTQIFSDGEKGITATKMNNIIANSVIQPDFVTAKPSSSTLDPTDQLLEVKGAGTYARITGSQLISSVSAQVDATPQIYSVRLRSVNAIGNSTFEVDQRNCFAAGGLSNPASPTLICDRWSFQRAGTHTSSPGTIFGQYSVVPGTSFYISQGKFFIRLTGQQASLGASDYLQLAQNVEGPRFRELVGDVSSISLLVYSDVALKFSVSMRSPDNTRSLCKLCTVSAAAWTLVTLPNIPVPSGGNFSTAVGANGYVISICLAAGSTLTAPANDTWQNGNFIGAVGMDNWCSKAVNTNFYCSFIQHEPGAVCTTPIDCPFTQNYDDCLRYFCKTYDYGIKPGTVSSNAVCSLISQGNADVSGWIPFPKRLAKVPSGGTAVYNFSTGTIQSIQTRSGSNITVNSINNVGESGFNGFTLASAQVANMPCNFHYIADTGW